MSDTSHLVGKSRFADESKRKKAIGQRGKDAESEVRAQLDKWNKLAGFAFHRLPDARAARGAIAKQPADYLAWYDSSLGERSYSIAIEVKEVKDSDYRLDASKITQLPMLHKLMMAGVYCYVLVKFRSGWRIADAGNLVLGKPSWNFDELDSRMSQIVFKTPGEALTFTGTFPSVE